MLTRCRKGLIIVSSKSFLRGAGRGTLLGKLEQEWITGLGDAVWVDWRLVAEKKCRLPHGRNTVTSGRTEAHSGPTPIVTPRSYRPPLLTVSSPRIHHRAPPTSSQASVLIQTPVRVSGEKQKSLYDDQATSDTLWRRRRSFPVAEQPSKHTDVNRGAPPTSPQAGVPIQPSAKVSGAGKGQSSTPDYTTTFIPRHTRNHTPAQTPGQRPDNSNESPSAGGPSFWGLAAGVAIAVYIGLKLFKPYQ